MAGDYKTRLQYLDEAVRKFLAWDSILEEEKKLNLSLHRVKQAETQRTAAESVVFVRLPETTNFFWLPHKQIRNQPRLALLVQRHKIVANTAVGAIP
jgi:hypothetical protein